MNPDSMLYVFVTLRSVHIAVAALWLGAAALLVWFVMPSAANLAPELVTRLVRNKMHVFIGSLAGTTALSGLLLYGHLTRFSAASMGSHAGIAYGIGGAMGLAALIIGGAVVGRSVAKIAELHASSGESARGSEATAAIQMLGRRAAAAGRVVVALLLATLVLMTLGHFV
jgi:hypothetical protein